MRGLDPERETEVGARDAEREEASRRVGTVQAKRHRVRAMLGPHKGAPLAATTRRRV